MNVRTLRPLVALGTLLLGLTATATGAQSLGVFRWQLQPYCNVVTVTVVQNGAQYHLDGTDDQCGAAQRASVVGMAFPNPDGSIGFGFTVVTAPGGTPIHVDARVSLASVGGSWRDSAGNSGTLVLTPGAGNGGAPRPVPAGGIAPGTITGAQLAPGSVGATQLAPGAISTSAIASGRRRLRHVSGRAVPARHPRQRIGDLRANRDAAGLDDGGRPALLGSRRLCLYGHR